MKNAVSGLSKKEIEVISFLELEEKFFFTRSEIRKFFSSDHSLSVFLCRLKKKRRIVKINVSKHYLIPIKAYGGHWSEHPFILIDEIFNGKDYHISGMAAAHYWGLIEQLPTRIEVKCTKKQGNKKIFGFEIAFRRQRRGTLRGFVSRKINDHEFLIASREEVTKWMKSR